MLIDKKNADSRLFFRFPLGFYHHRGSLEAELEANLVRQEAFGRKMQLAAVMVGKHDEGRGPDGRLGEVANPRAVLPAEVFDEAVELAGPDTVRGGLVALMDQREKSA